jgi:N-acetylmuramoyl-L-alanine amidase
MRWICLIFLVMILSVFGENPVAGQEKTVMKTVVIDAGHGGKDPGTIGQKVQEKKITLAIALKLGKLIRENYNQIKVIYTRDKDEFIELHQRAEIANQNRADLFISIHCNANPSHALHGAETYVMGLHRTAANLDIAKKENSSILMEPDYSKNYNGFDPNSDESYITFTLFQNAYLDQSTELAATIQDEMKDRTGLNDRGVRQAGFLVLYKTTMPSVLVETGFLSNPEEEKFLLSDNGQEYIASAIFKAFQKFRGSIEKSGNYYPSENKKVKQESPLKPETVVLKKEKPVPAIPESKVLTNVRPTVWFCVQVATEPKDIGIHARKFEGLKDVRMYRHQGMFKYTSGVEKSAEDALKLLAELKNRGFHDAFVIAFNGDERITIEQARKLISAPEKNK